MVLCLNGGGEVLDGFVDLWGEQGGAKVSEGGVKVRTRMSNNFG